MKQKILNLKKEIENHKHNICFGTKKLLQTDYEKFLEQRDSEIFFVGRAAEKACNNNFQIKYNKKDGTVEVEVIKQAGTVDILVKDTCAKIPREYADKIFEPFFRVDKSRSREMGGAGLGLALVKEIAIRHNGEVALLDGRKEGNIIRISFPRI